MSAQVEIRLDVPYGGGPDGALCNDVYLPAGPGPHPALLCFHGGAWAHGSHHQYQEWGLWLAARGYALVAVDYRLSKNISPSWPGVHEDIRRALRWLIGEAPGLRVDPTRLGFVGDSAGGHMAALLSLEDWVTPHLRAVVGVYGIYDLPDWWEVTQKRKDDPVGRLMGRTPAEAPEDYRRFSPLQGVEAQGVPHGVPYLIIHGEQDPIVHHNQSERFIAALRAAGAEVETLFVPDAGHSWFTYLPGEPDRRRVDQEPNVTVAPVLLGFLERNLASRGQSR